MNADLLLCRGKTRFGNKWAQGYYIPVGIFKGLVCGLLIRDVDPETVSRCTGKRDVNDKLIFVGDVLKVTWPSKISEFEFFQDYVAVGYKEDEGTFCYYGALLDEQNELVFEVVGNVLDNPEFQVFRYYPDISLDGIPVKVMNNSDKTVVRRF